MINNTTIQMDKGRARALRAYSNKKGKTVKYCLAEIVDKAIGYKATLNEIQKQNNKGE